MVRSHAEETCKPKLGTMSRRNKVCIACGETKPYHEFSFSNKEKNYRHSKCKACDKIYADKLREDKNDDI